ncbi:MAG: SIR2 family protein [Syntrophomonas sp.]
MAENILKIRDDECVVLNSSDDGFEIREGKSLSWLASGKSPSKIDRSSLRSGIEPWLTSLFQSEHLSLLVGTGLSYSLSKVATTSDTDDKATDTTIEIGEPTSTDSKKTSMDIPALTSKKYRENIVSSVKDIAEKGRRGNANIEDTIRVINELLRGLEILGHNKIEGEPTPEHLAFTELKDNLKQIILDFTIGISNIEKSIATAELSKREEAFCYLVNFLMSFASRSGTRERLNIFTTNYDRVIEAGAELAGLHLLDRFTGTLAPIFRSSRLDVDMHYNPPGIRGEPRYLEGVARFTKLHGSIDWVDTGTDIRRIGLPFGSSDIENFLNAPGLSDVDCSKVMIYPNSAKDRETAEYPYVELFRDFAAALCRPNSTLVTFGYGFGDEHINRVIKDMLTIPSTHLVIISFNDTGGRIIKKYEEIGRHSQITLIIGEDLAELKTLVDYFLPKPSIDKASIRMSELLRQRYSSIPKDESPTEHFPATMEGIEI